MTPPYSMRLMNSIFDLSRNPTTKSSTENCITSTDATITAVTGGQRCQACGVWAGQRAPGPRAGLGRGRTDDGAGQDAQKLHAGAADRVSFVGGVHFRVGGPKHKLRDQVNCDFALERVIGRRRLKKDRMCVA